MGFYDVDPPEYPEPDDYYIEEATERWYEMQAGFNEDCMTSEKDYIKDFKKISFLSERLKTAIEDSSGFYCEIDNDDNDDNKSLAAEITFCLNWIDKISARVRENTKNNLELSCLTKDDEDDEWIWDLAYDLDREASEPDPDAEYEAWRDQRDGYY